MLKFLEGINGRFLMDQAGDADGGGGEGGGDAGQKPGGHDPEGGGDPGDNPAPKGEGEGDNPDDPSWDEKTKAYIQSLRKENAKYRNTAKERDDRLSALEEMQAKRDKALKAALGMEDEDDDVPVEQRLEAATQVQNQLAFQNEVLQLALENGITGDQNEYFQFLVSKAVSELDDDGEFTDEDLAEIVAKVKGVSGSAGSGSTSVGTSGEGQTPPPASSGSDTITAEDFAKMSFSEKGQLFGKNEALYKKLNAEATAKNLI
jgi:hypothetical protein